MPAWYNDGDVVLCASSEEGTPNPILEAAACGRPCITTDVGLVPEFVRPGQTGLIVRRDPESFAKAICWCASHRDHVVRMGEAAREASLAWDWSIKIKQFGTAFDKLFEVPVLGEVRLRPDYTSHATACLITTGGSTVAECRRALDIQDCSVRIQEVVNVAPMSAAFQQMVDQCETPFLIEVDEDMILDPGSLRRMVYEIMISGPTIAGIAFPLVDPHAGQEILGCKVFRTEVLRKFPFNDTYSCERDQMDRMREAGYVVIHRPLNAGDAVGRHEVGHDPRTVYERYFRLAQKGRRFGYTWIPPLVEKFWKRLSTRTGEPRDLWGLVGLIHGFGGDLEAEGERNFLEVPVGFQLVEALLAGKEKPWAR
jgi:hypothetical protein